MSSSTKSLSRIEAAQRAVLAQTELMHREFGRAQSQWKSDGTRVTPVDLAISANIFRELGEQFPEDQFFSEELTQVDAPIPVTARFSWVLDPIDGTNNYAMGIAHCAISLALLENGQPIYGVIYDMSRRSLIHGGPGFGVKDGGREVHVLAGGLHRQALIGFHSPISHDYSGQAQRVIGSLKIRGLGSSTLHLAYVAAGILNGTIDHNVRIWDIAAAVPLVWAAGGSVEFLNGEQFPMREFNLKMSRIVYLAGSAETCRELRAILQG
ncbi:MAG: inositol monophosphatase [Opitutaceae bacterium]|nr:inositol monophosphatase [Opitutaceae bacterium]